MMNRYKIFFILQILILLACLGSPLAVGQKAGSDNNSSAVEVSLVVKKGLIVVGEKEMAVITVKNISSQDVSFPSSRYNFHVHIEGEKGEPQMTMLHRHQHGVYFPGDTGALADGGVTLAIASGASQSKEFDLGEYYNLSVPGKYTIYMEYRDEFGKWLRTNTAQFTIQAPSP